MHKEVSAIVNYTKAPVCMNDARPMQCRLRGKARRSDLVLEGIALQQGATSGGNESLRDKKGQYPPYARDADCVMQ